MGLGAVTSCTFSMWNSSNATTRQISTTPISIATTEICCFKRLFKHQKDRYSSVLRLPRWMGHIHLLQSSLFQVLYRLFFSIFSTLRWDSQAFLDYTAWLHYIQCALSFHSISRLLTLQPGSCTSPVPRVTVGSGLDDHYIHRLKPLKTLPLRT